MLRRIISLFLVFFFGCGYHFVGKGRLPGEIGSIAIAPLENQTDEPHLGKIMEEALRAELIRRRGVKVVEEGSAEAILKGKITSLHFASLAYDEEGRAREYRASISLDLQLIRREGQEVLWEIRRLIGREEFRVRGDIALDEGRKEEALREIARDLAREVYLRMIEGF